MVIYVSRFHLFKSLGKLDVQNFTFPHGLGKLGKNLRRQVNEQLRMLPFHWRVRIIISAGVKWNSGTLNPIENTFIVEIEQSKSNKNCQQ